MAEITLGVFIIGVLLIADPDRLQQLLERAREIINWLAE